MLWGALFLIGWLNCVVFVLIGAHLGGDALNSFRLEGSYFLADHGRITKVSASVWWYSFVHGLFTLATVLLAMIAGYKYERLRRSAEKPTGGPAPRETP